VRVCGQPTCCGFLNGCIAQAAGYTPGPVRPPLTLELVQHLLEVGATCAAIAEYFAVAPESIPAVVAICGALELAGYDPIGKAQQIVNLIRRYL
jgi:hypothetical protein